MIELILCQIEWKLSDVDMIILEFDSITDLILHSKEMLI